MITVKHFTIRAGAVLGATVLVGAVAAPAFAATVAQADATALTVSIAGEGGDSGTVTAVHDGEQLTKTGETQPPVSALQGQDLLDVGTLAQDATAYLEGGDGISEACSGVAGEGASVAAAGDGDCISGGDNMALNIANLDLSGMATIDPESALGPLQEALLDPIEAEIIEPLTAELSAALAENLGPLADLDIGGTLGAVESYCMARPGTADGHATITDGQIGITLGGETVGLIDLPVHPAPNTKVVTDLDAVLNAVIEGLETDLENTLEASLAGLTEATDEIQAQIVDTIINDVSSQLAPLEENFLDITLNKQTRPAQGAIEVTAIDLQVLPAAAEQLGASLVSTRIARVSCGPNSRVSALAEEPGKLPEVPTVIDSGVEGGTGGTREAVLAAGALLLTGLAGLIGYRRFLGAG